MKILACTDATVLLSVPACGTTLSSNNLKAWATRHGQNQVALEVSVTPPSSSGAVGIELTLPAGAKRGVWRITLETPCGCYETQAFFNGCQTPALVGTYFPTDTPYVPCAPLPALQPDLLVRPVVMGLVFSRAGDTIGIDLGAEPIQGRLVEPYPALTTVELTALQGGSDIVGSLAPVPQALDGANWDLYDAYGRRVANGGVTVAGAAGTLYGSVSRALGCGRHTLVITSLELP